MSTKVNQPLKTYSYLIYFSFFTVITFNTSCSMLNIEPSENSEIVFSQDQGYSFKSLNPSNQKKEAIIDLPNISIGSQQNVNSLSEASEASLIIETQDGTGSGFIFDKSGKIITNYHVVEDFEEVMVTYQDIKLKGFVTGWDQFVDIAIISTDWPHKNFHYLDIKPQDISIGSEIFTLGFPLTDILGRDLVVTKGIISANRNFESIKYLQTDAPLNPGSSGGPIINENGTLLGISTSGLRQLEGQNLEGISFALHVNELHSRLSKLAKGTKTEDPSWCNPKKSLEKNESLYVDWGVTFKGVVNSMTGLTPHKYQALNKNGLSEDPLRRTLQTRFLIDGSLPIHPNDQWFNGYGIDPIKSSSCKVSDITNSYKEFLENGPFLSIKEIAIRFDEILEVIESPAESIDTNDPNSIQKARWRQRFLTSQSSKLAQQQFVALIVVESSPYVLIEETLSILERVYSRWAYNPNSSNGTTWMRHMRDQGFLGFIDEGIFNK